MLNLSKIVDLAKVFIPENSPLRGRIEKAAELARGFSPSKDGIAQLMAQYGKNRDDLKQAVKMLDNPVVQNTLGRIPGLEKILRNMGNSLVSDPSLENHGDNNQMQTGGNANQGGFNDLMARFKRLK